MATVIGMPRPNLRRSLSTLLCAGVISTAALPAQQVSNHRIFVGIDLFVPTPTGRVPVLGFDGDRAILGDATTRRTGEIPAFEWSHRPKVGRLPVIIRDLETRYESTVQTDYHQRRLREMSHLLDYAASRENLPMRPDATLFAAPTEEDAALNAQLKHAAQLEFDEVALPPAARIHRGPLWDETAAFAPAPTGDNNVLSFSFDLVSPQPVSAAHLVVFAHIKQAGEPGVAVWHQALGDLGPAAQRFKVRHPGFQPGFELTALKLHVFAHGQELPTNLSERTAFFTADEAHRFLLLAHLADHPTGRLPPEPVWSLAPAQLFARHTAAEFDRPVAINVDADGHLLSIHGSETEARAYLSAIPAADTLRTKADFGFDRRPRLSAAPAAASDPHLTLPADLLAALREMVFLPALRNGTPVIGTTTVNLADFFR